jgi:hypothetical protein
MDLPSLRHFTPTGINSDPVEALVGEAWVPAIYTDRGWATADGANLLVGIEDWRHATQERQVAKGDLSQYQDGDEGGQTAKASSRNRAVKSRQITQTQS